MSLIPIYPFLIPFLCTTRSLQISACILGLLRIISYRNGSKHEFNHSLIVMPKPLTHWEYFDREIGGPLAVWRAAPADAAAPPEWPWRRVTVPHCATAADCVDPDRPYSQHPGWYRHRLDVRGANRYERLIIECGGLGQTGEVYIDHTCVYRQDLAYDAFEVDITDAVRDWTASGGDPAAVRLAIRVDNSRDLDALPSDLADFHRHRGLLRPVVLNRRPPIAIGALRLANECCAVGSGRIECAIRLDAHADTANPVSIRIQLTDPDGATVVDQTEDHALWTGFKLVELPAVNTVQPWHPEAPRLYTVHLTVKSEYGEHSVTRRLGFRRTAFEPHGPFLLNGARLEIRGTHRHEDAAAIGGAYCPITLRREMQQIKAMGANAIRLGHYPQDDAVLDLCDELGILVWEEIPWCRGGIGDAAYRERLNRSLRRMIERHRHHPCVVWWGLGNENDWFGDQPQRDEHTVRKQLATLHRLAKTLDPQRFTAIRRCHFAADIVDVYSPSIWAGWYRGHYREYRAALETWRDKVSAMVHAEWGGDSHAHRIHENPYLNLGGVASADGQCDERDGDFQRHGGAPRAAADGDWSESYICDLMDWHLKEQAQMPWMTGGFQWVFRDFATPLRPDNPIPYVNQKGLITRDGRPKDAYYVFQSRWANEPMLHIRGTTMPLRWGREGEPLTVRVDSNCERVRLHVDGVDYGERARNPRRFPAQGLSWEIPFKPGAMRLSAVGHHAGGGRVSRELSLSVYPAGWGPEHRLELAREPCETDRIRIRCRVLDKQGRLCLDSRRLLRLTCCGELSLPPGIGAMGGAAVVEAATGQAWWDLEESGPGAIAVSAQDLPTVVLPLSLSGNV